MGPQSNYAKPVSRVAIDTHAQRKQGANTNQQDQALYCSFFLAQRPQLPFPIPACTTNCLCTCFTPNTTGRRNRRRLSGKERRHGRPAAGGRGGGRGENRGYNGSRRGRGRGSGRGGRDPACAERGEGGLTGGAETETSRRRCEWFSFPTLDLTLNTIILLILESRRPGVVKVSLLASTQP